MSPNYPESYPTDVSCSWLIIVGEEYCVQLTILAFDLEHGYINNLLCTLIYIYILVALWFCLIYVGYMRSIFSFQYAVNRWDFLTIYNGETNDAPMLKVLTGSADSIPSILESTITSNGNAMFLHFLSDGSETRTGFEIQFIAGSYIYISKN